MKLMCAQVALATVLLVASACDDGSGPEAKPSDFEVHVYVEQDDSVGMGAADQPVPSLVTVASTFDDLVLVDSTGADGRVTFAQLPSGGYTITHAPTTPESALELQGSATQTVVAPFGGGPVLTRFVYGIAPGALTGVAFRDDNGSGGFEADEDAVFEGVVVRVFAGAEADTTGTPIAQDTTDADGRFDIGELVGGDYTLLATAIDGTAIAGANPRDVTIVAGDSAFEALELTGDPTGEVVSIADARAADQGDAVKVRGVVTAGQGAYREDSFYVQDSTGGVFVFGVDVDLGLEVGDSVEVLGERSSSRAEVHIAAESVTGLGTGTVPDPRAVTAAEVNDGAFQGELATLVAAVDSIVDAPGGYAVWVHDTAESAVVYVDDDSDIAEDEFTVGSEQSVTGILSVYDADDNDTVDAGEYHIKPRDVDDIE